MARAPYGWKTPRQDPKGMYARKKNQPVEKPSAVRCSKCELPMPAGNWALFCPDCLALPV
jgi:hypothetical protein